MRILPRLRVAGRRMDAFVTGASFAGCYHRGRFSRFVARRRPLPAGFQRGLTAKPWTVRYAYHGRDQVMRPRRRSFPWNRRLA